MKRVFMASLWLWTMAGARADLMPGPGDSGVPGAWLLERPASLSGSLLANHIDGGSPAAEPAISGAGPRECSYGPSDVQEDAQISLTLRNAPEERTYPANSNLPAVIQEIIDVVSQEPQSIIDDQVSEEDYEMGFWALGLAGFGIVIVVMELAWRRMLGFYH